MQGSHSRALFAVMAGASLLFGSAGIAAAQTVPFSLETGATTSQLLSFDQFNPALGTLTSVTITLSNSSTTGGGAVAILDGGAAGDFVVETITGSLDIGAPGPVTPLSEPTTATTSCTVLVGTATCSNGNPQDDPSFAANPATDSTDLAAFMGLGTVDLTASIDDVVNGGTFSSPTGTNGSFGGLAWSGDVTLTYNFTSVPEPASLALFGMGAGFLGLARRRRVR